jgi:hypothetical protein
MANLEQSSLQVLTEGAKSGTKKLNESSSTWIRVFRADESQNSICIIPLAQRDKVRKVCAQYRDFDWELVDSMNITGLYDLVQSLNVK